MKLPFKTTSGFTLLELMISMTIFGVMSVAIMSVYIQTTNLGQKMRMSRYLSETAREVTERIADDVREKGVTSTSIPTSLHVYWNGMSGYTQSGTEMIEISNSGYRYIYGRKSSIGIDPCNSLIQKDIKIHC